MSAKKISTVLLSIFVISAIVMMVDKMVTDENSNSYSPVELPETANIVYYFHGDYRCVTCEKIEKFTNESVKNNFNPQLNDGKLLLNVVNFDRQENRHFRDDFDLFTQSVVLVKIRKGEVKSWKNLEEVWELVEDEFKFKAFIVEEVKMFLEDN